MILWRSRETVEEKPALAHIGRRAWRWVIETGVVVNSLSIGLTEQVWFMDQVGNYKWDPATRYIDVALSRTFKWGSQHVYYDGPHCAFYAGFLHVHWAWNWCKKCMSD